jgi:osmotically inducible lipoprotein OsmB
MRKALLILCVTSLPLLSACGDNIVDRTLSGAGIGAGVGMIGSAVVGGAIWPGLLVGGAVGAATGVLTDDKQVNLGAPVWQKKGSSY